jgi:hypothetical protein
VASEFVDQGVATRVEPCWSLARQSLFFGVYRGAPNNLALSGCQPKSHEKAVVAPEISEVSPSFYEIYDQALESESLGLTQLTGIGLRKALEFLIKDYCVRVHPSDAAKIRGTMLGPCITNFVDDAKIKGCAKRAAWLGNDETHYVRKWEDRDVQDLKMLLKLTMLWVEAAIVTEKYEKGMPDA